MTKQKSTKRALLMSALALLMCVSMLIGSTFAWFTDSVTSGNNIIKAGNLDVVLEYSTDGDTWNTVDATTKVFNDKALWEPGHREVVMFRVRNAGTLHLKYEMLTTVIEEKGSVNVYGEDFKLSDYLTLEAFCYGKDSYGFDAMVDNFFASRSPWFIMEEFEFGKNMNVATTSQTMAPGFEHYYFVAITMPETVGNEANYADGNEAPYINFAINLVATQATVESDSFDNKYDKDAPYILPQGVTTESFDNAETVYTYAFGTENRDDMNRGMKETTNVAVAYYNGSYYDSLTSAVNAARLDTDNVGATIYLKPEAELVYDAGYGNVTENLTVYGNGAKVIGGDSVKRLAVEVAAGRDFTSDVTINVYELDGVVVWGNRTTEYTLNVNIYDSLVGRVYINKTTGVNNIKVENCTFDAAKGSNSDTSVYSNANGTIVVNNSTFNGISCAINLNHKVDGTQTVVLTNNTFVDCGTGAKDYYAAIRAIGTSANAVTNLTVTGNTVTYSDGVASANEADVLLNTDYTSGSNGATSATGSIVADIQDDLTVKNGNNVTVK